MITTEGVGMSSPHIQGSVDHEQLFGVQTVVIRYCVEVF